MPSNHMVSIGREQPGGQVTARGGDPRAHSILQRAAWVPVVRLNETYHRLPHNLDTADERRLAVRAVSRLRTAGCIVAADAAFDTQVYSAHRSATGAVLEYLAECIRGAATTDEAAEALTELTADHDGVLEGLHEVLNATADLVEYLGQPPDRYVARRLRHLADEHLGVISSDLRSIRNDLADRHEQCGDLHVPHRHDAPAAAVSPTVPRHR
ncbi:hypothetical protein ACL02R_11585 [Streptomyces sp. MS19]|uniref:hypothetical protein n=1 Tax=Streptomyces sp. MS19 TaxID=3385972 RepID=UPI0039A15280